MSPEAYQERMRELGIKRGALDGEFQFKQDMPSVVPDCGRAIDYSKRMKLVPPPPAEDLSRFQKGNTRRGHGARGRTRRDAKTFLIRNVRADAVPFYRALWEGRQMTGADLAVLAKVPADHLSKWLSGRACLELRRKLCALLTADERRALPVHARDDGEWPSAEEQLLTTEAAK